MYRKRLIVFAWLLAVSATKLRKSKDIRAQ
jgi:hypothetical protein